jgi:uncharacterized protein (DUF2164 family)
MAIELERENREALIASIQSYFSEHMEEEVGQLKAGFLLDYFLEEIGPAVYNQAVRDAAAYFQGKVEDLDSTCYQPEMNFWSKDR